MAPILTTQQVTKRFGGLTAVSRLDVAIEENSIHSIIGPNGAGKTTFFNCITGFYRPEEGAIVFEGDQIDGMSTDRIMRRGIARTYQNIRLFQNMTVIENVMVGYQSHLKSGWLGAVLHTYPSEMAQNFWTAIMAWSACFLATIGISLATPRLKTDDELRGVDIIHHLTMGEAPYIAPGMEESFRLRDCFVAANTREAVNEGRADYIPIHLHEMPRLFRRGVIPLDPTACTARSFGARSRQVSAASEYPDSAEAKIRASASCSA